MSECENCPNETFTDGCVDCGCNLCDDCKIVIQNISFCDLCIVGKNVEFAGFMYEVANVSEFAHSKMIGIYDEHPSKHIDYIKPESLKIDRFNYRGTMRYGKSQW